LCFEPLEPRVVLTAEGGIQGLVFYDGNGNGQREANEVGLAGWTLFLDDNDNHLQDGHEPAVTSDAAGTFRFSNVALGGHLVRQVDRPGWVRTVPFGDGYAVVATTDETASGIIFGNHLVDADQYATISGFKWNDLDRDGLRDADELGLPNWQIYLDLNHNLQRDSFEPFDFTNAAGRYAFTNLPPGMYVVREVQQTGWQQSFPTTGGHTIGLVEGQVVDPVNFGNHLALPGQLAGSKWRDLDQDGVRDPEDPGLANWQFYLDDNQNGVWDTGESTATTNALGVFGFLGLAPGEYRVGEILPSGWTQTSPGPSNGFTASHVFDLPSLPLLAGLATATGEFATGDLDGDGDLDVVATTRQSVMALYNDGNGGLAALRELMLPVGASTGALALVDLNGDHRLDIVAGGYDAATGVSQRLFTFLNGAGGFGGQPVDMPSRVIPDFLVQGDFNADGSFDLAVAARAGREIALFLGDGHGGLNDTPMPSLIAALGMEFSGLVAADFDQNGRTDLAAIGRNGLVTGPLSQALFQGWQSQATGDFLASNPLTINGTARDLFADDLRGDAIPELVALIEHLGPNGTTTSLQELSLAAWQATLANAWMVHDGAGLDQPRTQALDAADFDRDGNTDLVVLDTLGRSVWILNGRTNGSFDSSREIPLGDQPLAVMAAILDGDAAPDLAVLNQFSSSVSVLRNDGWGGFPHVDRWHALQPLDEVSSIDLDDDGDLDLVGFNLQHGQLSVAINQGRGRFGLPRLFPLEPNLAAVLFGHLDADGFVDLVTIANGQTETGASVFRVVTRLDVAANGLLNLPGILSSLEFPGRATSGSLANVDADNRLDLVVTFGEFAPSPELECLTLLGSGGGLFTALTNSALRPRLAGQDLFVDLDGDGDLDRVQLQSIANTISLEWNQGGGIFTAPEFLGVGQSPQYAVAGDFDGDQDLDLLVANAASANLSLWLNDGDGGLTASDPIAVGGHPVSLAAVDFDRDGLLDVAVVDDANAGVRILRSTGPAVFEDLGLWAVGAGPAGIVAGDWNRDDLMDLATVNTTGGSLTVLLQTAGIAFTTTSLVAGPGPHSLSTGYLDADEFLDLYVSRDVLGSRQLFEFLNDGLGSFGDPLPLNIDRGVRDTTIGDMTGDDLPDLVVVDDFSRSLLVFPGQGNGYFQAPLATPLDARPHFVRPLDVDNDGDQDLSIGWLDRAGIGLLINDGVGNFTPGMDYVRGQPPKPYWTGDLDDDGRQDYVIPDPDGGFYDIGRGLGDGTFAPPISLAGELPGSVDVGDLDGDGNLDLICSLLGEQFAVYWNQTRPDDQYRVTVLPGQTSTGLSFGNYKAPLPWQNPRSLLDVNDDTFVSPIDALLVIDRLNAGGAGLLPPLSDSHSPPPYYDPSGDNYIAPNDALIVINYLNLLAGGEMGEGESVESTAPQVPLARLTLFAAPASWSEPTFASPAATALVVLDSLTGTDARRAIFAAATLSGEATVDDGLQEDSDSRNSSSSSTDELQSAIERFFSDLDAAPRDGQPLERPSAG